MLERILEAEVMDSAAEADDYDAMDHAQVNRVFVDDFLHLGTGSQHLLDVGTGTAQIPIELCRRNADVYVIAIDMAEHMLAVGRKNLERENLTKRIQLQHCDAKKMPFASDHFDAVISNSIVHHIPEPLGVLSEMVRVIRRGGSVFVRDLLRPADEANLQRFVETYAGDANVHQRTMFADSLHAALTLEEIRGLVNQLGFDKETVQQTSDRHWTWAAQKA